MKITKGFTLIELLVVIAIIGILSAFFVNTSQVNLQRGRDGKRKTDLELIRAGIETYRSDCNTYPANDQLSFGGTLIGSGSPTTCRASNTYIKQVPQDAIGTANYSYFSNGTTYELCAHLETGTGSVICTNSCGASACNYKVTSP